MGVCQYFLRGSVRSVDGSAKSAHQCHSSVQVTLKRGNVVFRECSLPHLNSNFSHIIYNGNQIGVCVVNCNNASGANIAIKTAVWLFQKFPPHLWLHKQGVFCAPIVMGEHYVWLQTVDEHFDILQTVLQNVLNQRVHFIRMLIESGQRVFKTHQEMAFFKNAGSHKTGYQCLFTGNLTPALSAFFPACGAVCQKIRGMNNFFPARYIRAYRNLRAVEGHRAGR